MSGKGLLKRIGITLLLTAGLFVFLSAIDADAAPIRPNIRKLVTNNQAQPQPMAPARAGWDGPEMQREEARVDPALDPAVILRSNKAAIITAAVPDPRAILAVAVIIFLMRLLRNVQEKQKRAAADNVVSFDQPRERIAA